MRRFLLSCLLLAGFVSVGAQDDPVIMNVAGNDIHRSEFEYFFYKNNKDGVTDLKTLLEYSDLYVNFKLKVEDAKSMGIDTLSTFKREYREYRNKDAEPLLIDSVWFRNRAVTLYDDALLAAGPKGLYEVAMISIPPLGDSEEDVIAAKMLADSVYQLAMDSVPFAELAKQYSYDLLAEDGGYIGFIGESDVPEFVSDVVFRVEPFTITKPVLTEVGWLIFEVISQKEFGSFEDHEKEIYDFMWKNGYSHYAKLSKARQYAKEQGWDMTDEEALALMDSTLEKTNLEFGNISREYYEGLLLFEISNRRVWSRVSSDTAMIENWFAGNKEKYVFDKPVFKGCIVFCKTEEDYNELKQFTDGAEVEDLPDMIRKFDAAGERVRFIKGPFKKGESSFCDAVVFNEGKAAVIEPYVYSAALGHVAYSAEVWTDMQGKVLSDCQDYQEKLWVKELRDKYKFKVNKKVLKTVGKH